MESALTIDDLYQWLWYVRKHPWSTPAEQERILNHSRHGIVDQLERQFGKTLPLVRTCVPTVECPGMAESEHRYQKNIIFVKTSFSRDGIEELRQLTSMPKGSKASYQEMLVTHIGASLRDFELNLTRPPGQVTPTDSEHDSEAQGDSHGSRVNGPRRDGEHVIPGPVEILVGSNAYDLMISLDVTSDNSIFHFVPNVLRRMPCVTNTHTVTVRSTATFPSPSVEPAPAPATKAVGKRGLAERTVRWLKRRAGYLRQHPWSTEEDQADFFDQSIDRYRRDCKEKILNGDPMLGIETYVPRAEYGSMHELGLQRYLICVETQYLPSEAKFLREQAALHGQVDERGYQHEVADAIRSRLASRLLRATKDARDRIAGIVGDIFIVMSDDTMDLLVTLDVRDDALIGDIVVKDIREIPCVKFSSTIKIRA